MAFGISKADSWPLPRGRLWRIVHSPFFDLFFATGRSGRKLDPSFWQCHSTSLQCQYVSIPFFPFPTLIWSCPTPSNASTYHPLSRLQILTSFFPAEFVFANSSSRQSRSSWKRGLIPTSRMRRPSHGDFSHSLHKLIPYVSLCKIMQALSDCDMICWLCGEAKAIKLPVDGKPTTF